MMNCSVRGLVCSWPKCREDQPKLGQDWIVAVETMKEIQDQCKRTSIELLNLVILIWKGKKNLKKRCILIENAVESTALEVKRLTCHAS